MLPARRPRPLPSPRCSGGFTLLELLVTMTVAFIFFVMAVPSFSGMRQRAAIRGAADETLTFWNEARFEAVKRNRMVKVGVFADASGAYCLGAATTDDESDGAPCDCLSAAPTSNVCDVSRWPSNQSEWNGVRLAGASIAGSSGTTTLHPVVIEPKRTTLTLASARGTIGLASAPGPAAYRLNLSIDQLGHGLLCESLNATGRLSDYTRRRCAD
jgi:type II secretory pathway pseudopilin PulG